MSFLAVSPKKPIKWLSWACQYGIALTLESPMMLIPLCRKVFSGLGLSLVMVLHGQEGHFNFRRRKGDEELMRGWTVRDWKKGEKKEAHGPENRSKTKSFLSWPAGKVRNTAFRGGNRYSGKEMDGIWVAVPSYTFKGVLLQNNAPNWRNLKTKNHNACELQLHTNKALGNTIFISLHQQKNSAPYLLPGIFVASIITLYTNSLWPN